MGFLEHLSFWEPCSHKSRYRWDKIVLKKWYTIFKVIAIKSILTDVWIWNNRAEICVMIPPFTIHFAGPHCAGRLRDPRRDEPGALLSIVLSSFHQNLPNSLLCFQRWPVTIIAYLLFWTFPFIGNGLWLRHTHNCKAHSVSISSPKTSLNLRKYLHCH